MRSTDYGRTLLSAAALLQAMTRDYMALRPSRTRPLALYTEEDEAGDIMHGVGLASSTKQRQGDAPEATSGGAAETSRQGACKRAARLALEQIRAWQPAYPDAWRRFASLFGAGIQTTAAADALYARACHDVGPPCSQTRGGCVDELMQRQIWRDADSFYCSRFSGAEGGDKASRLSMLPLLKELFARLEAAAAPSSDAPRFVLFSGHDTVIAPLLAALGGLRAPGACRWPPYASHVAFELWETRWPLGERRQWVRVVFNGRAITQHLLPCESAASALAAGAEYCRLDRLQEHLRTLGREFDEGCRRDE